MWPTEFHLLRPLWLLALVPALILLVLLWRRRRAGGQRWRRVVDAHLLPHLLVGADSAPPRLPLWLLAVGWLLAILALSGPAWERLPQPVFATDAAQVIVLDLSPSMNAADLRPSRLARARFEILDLLNASGEGQSALLAFGPAPFVVSPLTRDARTIASQVPDLTTDLLPVPGPRDTARALRAAGELLGRAGAYRGAIILVTDQVGDMAQARLAVQELVASGHRVSVLGMGTLEGAPVPLSGGAAASAGEFERKAGGGIQIAHLAQADLRALAALGEGRYAEAQTGDADTRALLSTRAVDAELVEEPSLLSDQWREEGPWLLLALLPLAALAFRPGWLVPVLACLMLLPPSPGWAFGWSDLWWRADQQAARQLQAGAPDVAPEQFRDPAWRAAANYRAGEFEQALETLQGLPDPDTDYNRGNALARLGRLDEAIEAYERVLARDPEHDDARHNRDVVTALREQPPESSSNGDDGEQGDSGGESEGEGEQGESGGEGNSGGESGGEGGDASGPTDQERSPDSAGQDPSTGDGTSQDGSSPETASSETSEGEPTEGETGAGETSAGEPQDPGAAEGDELAQAADAPNADGAAGDPGPAPSGADATPGKPPGASDLDPHAPAEEETVSLPEETTPGEVPGDAPNDNASTDLNGVDAAPSALSDAALPSPESLEREQALEAQLRRVPDDPGGLLKQRFILQHLRREGRLP